MTKDKTSNDEEKETPQTTDDYDAIEDVDSLKNLLREKDKKTVELDAQRKHHQEKHQELKRLLESKAEESSPEEEEGKEEKPSALTPETVEQMIAKKQEEAVLETLLEGIDDDDELDKVKLMYEHATNPTQKPRERFRNARLLANSDKMQATMEELKATANSKKSADTMPQGAGDKSQGRDEIQLSAADKQVLKTLGVSQEAVQEKLNK